MEVGLHGLLGLVYHFEERLEHVVMEAQGPKWGEGQDAPDQAGLGVEEVWPPEKEAEAGEVVSVLGLLGKEPVLKECVHDAGHPVEAVLHGIQDVGLLPVAFQEGVNAITIHPEVGGRALVQELLELGYRQESQ